MAQTVAFFTGFETGDASEMSNLPAGASIQTATVRSGGYALKLAATNINFASVSLTAWSARFAIYIPTLPGAATTLFGENALQRGKVMVNANGTLRVADNAATLGLTATNGTIALATGAWNIVGMAIDLTAGGAVRTWVNGVLDINITHTSGVSATPATAFSAKAVASPNEYFFDDIMIQGGGVAYAGDGRCIARQGINSKATTPTYTAWTKNGLTTSGECWSETPFGTTNNCTDTLLNDAQTMVVDKFSVDPSRAVEGTQAISSAATINAVKVCAIAKISLTTSQAQAIRRRVSSTDTDALVTLTTSDAFYSTAIFTDTAANLDAYEIGMATNATGLGTRTVEDMWMMVDYTPAANTLAAGVGSFTLTGNALTLPVGRKAALASGAFALTGQSLTFANGHAFSLGAGSFALSGQALALLVNHVFKTGVGAFTLSGEPITGARSVLAHLDAGAFIVTGEATSLLKALSFSLDVGPFVFTGRGIAIAKNSVPFNLGGGTYLVNSVNGAGKTLWRISKFYPSVTLPPVAPKGRLEEVRVSQPSLENWRNG